MTRSTRGAIVAEHAVDQLGEDDAIDRLGVVGSGTTVSMPIEDGCLR